MATKRGMCPYCKSRHYFLVNPEATVCFCGNYHQMEPELAINTYENYVNNAVAKADDTLEVVCNPILAYKEYADVIEFDDSITKAYLGRILCLVYMSKVRKAHIDDARILLNTGTDKYFKKPSDAPLIISYLRKTVRVVEDYLTAVNKRLTFRDYFYGLDCLTLYLTHVQEVIDFENEVLETALFVKKKYESEKIDALLNFLDEKISSKERILKDYSHILVTGDYYKFNKIEHDKTASVVQVPKKHIDTKTSRYRMASLDIAENKTKRYIKDEVFKDYTDTIRARKFSFFWFGLFYTLAAASGICIYAFKDDFTLTIVSILGLSVFFILGTIFLILNLFWGSLINKKKRKLEIY